jgi:hypothetical protein
MLHLHVCGEDQKRRLRKFFTDHVSCLEALRPMGWRHADVDDREPGLLLPHHPHQFRSVPRLANHVVAGPLEQARKALAHQHVIVGDDDARAGPINVAHHLSIPQDDRRDQSQDRWGPIHRPTACPKAGASARGSVVPGV